MVTSNSRSASFAHSARSADAGPFQAKNTRRTSAPFSARPLELTLLWLGTRCAVRYSTRSQEIPEMNTTQNPGEQNRPDQNPQNPRPDQGQPMPRQPKPGAPNTPRQPGTPDSRQHQAGAGKPDQR